MTLNDKESRVLSRIRENPYISQKDLAEEVGLSRSSIANIISGLVHKHYLLGRAYVINEDRPVICIGGMNIDRLFELQDEPRGGISHKVKTYAGAGGCARNLAENLGRMNIPVSILTLVGEDAGWQVAKTYSQSYMNLAKVEVIESCPTGNYTEILDRHGEMILGMAETEIYDNMTPRWLSKHLPYLETAQMIVVDTNLPKDSLEQLISFAERREIPLVLISVSIPKIENIPSSLEGVDALIIKHNESAQYLGMPAETNEELKKSLRKWKEKGADFVFIVKDNEKVAYTETGEKEERVIDYPEQTGRSYQCGGCEALGAGWVYGRYQQKAEEEKRAYALTNAYYTMQKDYTVRPDLSQKVLEKDVKQYWQYLKEKGLPE